MNEMKEYLQDAESVLKEQSSSHSGISQEEAQKRLEQNGRNKLQQGKRIYNS